MFRFLSITHFCSHRYVTSCILCWMLLLVNGAQASFRLHGSSYPECLSWPWRSLDSKLKQCLFQCLRSEGCCTLLFLFFIFPTPVSRQVSRSRPHWHAKYDFSVSQFCYFTSYKSEYIQSALELNKLAFALLMFWVFHSEIILWT